MELKIKPFSHNLYPKRAILIKGNSPKNWISELQKLGINLNSARSFVIYDKLQNEIACLVVLPEKINFETFQHQVFQLAGNSLFIPEFSTIFPEIATNEWKHIFPFKKYFIHPEIGFQILDEEIDWLKYLKFGVEQKKNIVKPLPNVKIPKEMKSLLLDLDEKELLKELEQNEKPDPSEKVPFDMKKLLKGNQRELQKYLKFLEENPEKALQYAIPLDVLNASRDTNPGFFKFGNANSGVPRAVHIFGIIFTSIFFMLLFKNLGNCSSDNSKNAIIGRVQDSISMYQISTVNTPIQKEKDSLLAISEKKIEKKYKSDLEISKKLHKSELKINDSLKSYYSKKFITDAIDLYHKDSLKYIKQYLPIAKSELKANEFNGLKKTLLPSIINHLQDSLQQKNGFAALEKSKPVKLEIQYLKDSLISQYFKKEKLKNLSSSELNQNLISKTKFIEDSLQMIYKEKITVETSKIFWNKREKVAEMKKNIPKSSTYLEKDVENRMKKSIRDSLSEEYGYIEKLSLEEQKNNPEMKENEDSIEISLFDSFLRAAAFIILALFGIFVFSKRNYNQNFWESISFSEDGQNNLAKILAIIVIISIIVYLLKPLLETLGYNWYFCLIIVIIFILLLRLLNKNKTLLKSDDDEDHK